MTETFDTALRLAVPVAFTLPELTDDPAVSEVREDASLDLCAGYWDTTDRRLAGHGVTLRRRSGDAGEPRWTLELPMLEAGTDGGRRGNGRRRLVPREIDLEGDGDRIPEHAVDLVTAYARTAPLVEIAELRTRRRIWSLLDARGGVVALLHDDDVTVMDAGTPTSRVRELALEARTIGGVGVDRLARRLREAGAVDAAPISEAIRALAPETIAPADAAASAVGPELPAAAAVRAALTEAVERVLAHDAGVRLGDDESLHQARVGLRILRSHLRTFAPLIDQRWSKGLAGELRGLGRVLGRVRDLDVLLDRLEADARDLHPLIDPLLDDVRRRRDAARDALLERLRDERYASLLERLVTAAAAPRLVRHAARPARETLPALGARAWKKLDRRAARVAAAPSDASLHRVRIAAKRARYAAEAIAPALGDRRRTAANAAAQELATLQGLLGRLQDAVVAREEILAAAARRPENGPFNLAAGRLLERETRHASSVRDAFPDAWRRVRRPRHRRWARA